ncbi:unnamed protein product [Vitrella brassicaformis CCMP3155]|uniref:Peptidase M16 N-terminal domain-containing protein n=4 Tax=Vitrella brassicaformis TaxID=1169539 RepID=A0A0G4GF49_VITBC|nr:unnamed protein product [Vitrella brassicaformis CCMP3155]|eukprot:CEM28165.1 unnamed protein product [Vitrella brassicaformis CCMP3155]
MGRLANGMEYRVLPHSFPPRKVVCYMAVNSGSLHEDRDEQGLAHFLEHLVFLGTARFPSVEASKKELAELGMAYGGDLNAYTDFNQTVYTLHSPTEAPSASSPSNSPTSRETTEAPTDHPAAAADESGSNTYRCLVLLRELCFEATLEGGKDFDTEKKNVMSEEQMRNTVAYRVEKRLFDQMHGEDGNMLKERWPIGDMRVIQKCTPEKARAFYKKWYTPDNMCLFVVGDIEAEAVVRAIHSIFADIPSPSPTLSPSPSTHTETEAMPPDSASAPVLEFCKGGRFTCRGSGRLPSSHAFFQSAKQREVVVQHDLLRLVSITIGVKEPMVAVRDRRESFITVVDTTIDLVLHSRLADLYDNTRDPPFLSILHEYLNSARENCAWNVLVLSAKPTKWKEALHAAIQEIAKLCLYGVSAGELKWATQTLLKQWRDAARQESSIESSELMEELLDDWTVGNITVDREQEYQLCKELAPLVTPQIVQDRAKLIFPFVTDYFDAYTGREGRPRGSIFVYGPTHMNTDTQEGPDAAYDDYGDDNDDGHIPDPLGGEEPSLSLQQTPALIHEQAVKKISALRHLDVDMPTMNSGALPKGPRLRLRVGEVLEVLRKGLQQPEQPSAFELPDWIVDPHEIESKMASLRPRFIPPLVRSPLKSFGPRVCAAAPHTDDASEGYTDPRTDVVLLRLQNGVTINAKKTDFEPNSCDIHLAFTGGVLLETDKSEQGASNLGLEAIFGGGVCGYPNKVIRKLLPLWGLSISSGSDKEGVVVSMALDANADEGVGLERSFQLIHAFMTKPTWDLEALERARNAMLVKLQLMETSMDSQLAIRLADVLFCGDHRCSTPSVDQVKDLSVDTLKTLVRRQLQPERLEISVVGDFDLARVKELALRYLGTLENDPEHTLVATDDPADVSVPFAPIKHFDRSQVCRVFIPDEQNANRCTLTVAFRNYGRYDTDKARAFHNEAQDSGEEGEGVGDGMGYHGDVDAPMPLLEGERYKAHPFYRFRLWRLIDSIVNNRIFKEIREHRGLAYAADFTGSHSDLFDDGVVFVTVNPSPEKAAKAFDAVMLELHALATDRPPTENEFTAALAPTLAGIASNLETNDYWLTLLYGLQDRYKAKDLSHIHSIADFYAKITLDDVKDELRHRFNPSPCVTGIGLTGSRELEGLGERLQAAIEKRVRDKFGADESLCNQLQQWPSDGWEEVLEEDQEWVALQQRKRQKRWLVWAAPAMVVVATVVLGGLYGLYSGRGRGGWGIGGIFTSRRPTE